MPPDAAADHDVVARYNSQRTPENIYEVWAYADGRLWCTCPGWRFKKKCRHMARHLSGLDDDTVVAERLARALRLFDVCVATDTYASTRPRQSAEASLRAALAPKPTVDAHFGQGLLRFLAALDESGLFAPQPAKAERSRSRGARVITLDDD